VIILYPLLLISAALLAWRSRMRRGGRGPAWFAGWALAGFLFSFSLITGLSIGLFILPLAAFALLLVARNSPHLLEAAGFLVGVAATAVLVVTIGNA
jgi:hypothetical protein